MQVKLYQISERAIHTNDSLKNNNAPMLGMVHWYLSMLHMQINNKFSNVIKYIRLINYRNTNSKY